MNLPPRTLPWILAGVTLAIVAALLGGLHQGALTLPAKGTALSIQRLANPLGFWLLALCYAALAGASGWLLVAVLRADASARPTAGAPARKDRMPVMNPPGSIQISQQGRGGHVLVSLDSGSHSFWWEFGGGDCVVVIDVPRAQQWHEIPALAPHPRQALLEWLAGEVGRRQCPGARIIIFDASIAFHQ